MKPIASVQFTTADAIAWPPPPDDWATRLDLPLPMLQAQHRGQAIKTVHVWAASLQVSPKALKMFAASLAPDETERATRFRFPIHRDRFIAGRGLLRQLLATYLGVEPRSLDFRYGARGKPALAGSSRGVQFNVAHSEDLLLMAITRDGVVGVDVERVRGLPDFEELVSQFFSPNECSQFRKLSSEQKPAAFFNLWTRKEAWLKATGEGITHLLNQVEVSFLPSEPAWLIRLPNAYVNTSSWSLYELAPQPGFTAALALAGDAPAIHCWHHQHC